MKIITSPVRHFFTWIFFLLLFFSLFANSKAAEDSKAFLWRVQSETATVFILGSMHFASQELYPLNPVIEESFAASDTLVLELNPLTVNPEEVQSMVLKKGFYPSGETIQKHISPEVFVMLEEHIAANQLPGAQLMGMKPGMLALNLTTMQLMKLGFSPELGIDLYFARLAGEYKPIVSLETIKDQLSLFFSMPDGSQFLSYTLQEIDTIERFMNQTVAAWNVGDTETMYDVTIGPFVDNPEFKPFLRRIYYNRNLKMASKIRKFLKTDQTHFVVVGAGHLVGDQSIIKLLEKQGYGIEQLHNR